MSRSGMTRNKKAKTQPKNIIHEPKLEKQKEDEEKMSKVIEENAIPRLKLAPTHRKIN